MEINDENCKEEIFEYASRKYSSRFLEFFRDFHDEFPDKYENLSEELYFKNFMDWFILEKPLPETGKTIVEEFVDEHRDIDEEMRRKLLRMKDMVRSKFIVLAKNGRELKIKDLNSKRIYEIRLHGDNAHFGKGHVIEGRIHPFGEKYRFAGVFLTRSNYPFIYDPEILMNSFEDNQIKKAESVVLSPHSQLTAVLNKYPFQWVDGICNKLSISTKGKKPEKVKIIADKLYSNLDGVVQELPETSKLALKYILDNGGAVKYVSLKKYDDEMSFWWNERPPSSSLGILRVFGLVVVGKMLFGNKFYRVAMVPIEIREKLVDILS